MHLPGREKQKDFAGEEGNRKIRVGGGVHRRREYKEGLLELESIWGCCGNSLESMRVTLAMTSCNRTYGT